MTFFDFADKHIDEVSVLVFVALVCAASVLSAWAHAFGKRGRR